MGPLDAALRARQTSPPGHVILAYCREVCNKLRHDLLDRSEQYFWPNNLPVATTSLSLRTGNTSSSSSIYQSGSSASISACRPHVSCGSAGRSVEPVRGMAGLCATHRHTHLKVLPASSRSS